MDIKNRAMAAGMCFGMCMLFLLGCGHKYVTLEEIKEEGSNLDSVDQESVLLEYEFQMPQISRISGQAAEKIKTWQEEELEVFKQELEARTSEADADCQERKSDPDEEKRGWGVPCIYSVNYSVFQSAGTISFLKMEYQYYSGGAHGTTGYLGTVFDSDTGDRMTLDDFLGEKENGRAELARYLIGQLDGETLWDDYQEVIMDKLAREPEFYVEGDDLVFLFDQYELASYAQGPFFLKVPLKELAGR